MKYSFSYLLMPLAALAVLLCVPLGARAVTADDVDKALDDLDSWLKSRHKFIEMRQDSIDSLCVILNSKPVDDPAMLMKIAECYTAFNNDSALVYLRRGAATTPYPQNLAFRWKCASLMPLSGFFDAAEEVYDRINPDSIPSEMLVDYYDAGRQMHSYIAAFFRNFPDVAEPHDSLALVMQAKMLDLLPPDSPLYKYNLAEYNFLKGRTSTAKVLLEEVIDSEPPSSNFRARAANHLSTLARAENDTNAFFYYIALSATADVLAATREVVSLQELGAAVYAAGDITRAHRYLSSALENAVECGAPLRMIDSSRSLPIIERAHSEHLAQNRRTIYYIISGMAVLLLVLVIVLLVLRHEMHRMTLLQNSLRAANTAKEVYISRFLQLCSIYMDKLNQFCKIANRKLAAGQADELYRMTRSGKFVEEQSREFYDVFDNAFLHIYPDFVERVNALLRSDAQIELQAGELLNTDLRILAFMRLGIEESARIAQILNYSLNTIYAYRNRLKARAINRDTFEADIMTIDS